jgi:hypothetical protein
MNRHDAAASASDSLPPDGLPRYRLLTGIDDDAFCRRVSEALERGYVLYGSPALTTDGTTAIAAQAVLWPAPPAR